MTNHQKLMAAALAAAVVAAAGSAFAVGVGSETASLSLELTFRSHFDDGLPEQDVFIEREPGMAQIYRPTKDDRDKSKPLFAPIVPVRHSPFEPENVGPWTKGKPLGLTLGEWLAAEGQATYRCADGRGRLVATFTNLVPNGVYTLRHTFLASPPTDPVLGSYDLPLGARDGSEAIFRANAEGSAMVVRDFEPCLQLTGEQLMSGLAIAWHSDGKSHGAHPGSFSTSTHVQLYVELPKRSGI
ncbi:MAG: hypothetical protein ACFCUQ_02600 [Kiloniellales bacterium]